MIGSPSPSHPTVRSVFPSTAVRQSSSYIMRRFRLVREHAAANVGEPHRIQLAVRKALPSETPAFTSLSQVPAKTDVDEALEPSERLAGVGVPEVVDPPRHYGIHHIHAFLRTDRRSSRRAILQAVPHFLLGGLGWEDVDGLLAAPGTLAFHKVEADEITPIGHACHARLGAVEGQIHPLGDAREGGKDRLRASATYQDGIIGVAVEGGTKLRRIVATMPQLIQQVQVNVAVQRRNRGALWHPNLRWYHLPLDVHPDRERLLNQ